jgi:hypothetical protein
MAEDLTPPKLFLLFRDQTELPDAAFTEDPDARPSALKLIQRADSNTVAFAFMGEQYVITRMGFPMLTAMSAHRRQRRGRPPRCHSVAFRTKSIGAVKRGARRAATAMKAVP